MITSICSPAPVSQAYGDRYSGNETNSTFSNPSVEFIVDGTFERPGHDGTAGPENNTPANERKIKPVKHAISQRNNRGRNIMDMVLLLRVLMKSPSPTGLSRNVKKQ